MSAQRRMKHQRHGLQEREGMMLESDQIGSGWVWLRRVAVGAGLVLALAAPAQPQAEGDAWMKVPAANLDGLEEAVARQLESLRDFVAGKVADEESTAGELAEAFGELGSHYHAYGLLEPAEQCYTIARRLTPGDFRWPYLMGFLYQSDGRLEPAVEQYVKALSIVPNVTPALIRLGQTYFDLNRPADAERVLTEALRLDQTSAAALAVLGQVYQSTGRHAEAVDALEAALEQEPEADLLYYPLGLAYRELGEIEKAVDALSRRGDVGIKPGDPLIDGLARLTTGERVHVLRGRAAFAAGRFAEAAEEFRSAVEMKPDSVPARVNLAAALAQGGDVDGAIEQLLVAVEIAPGNATAQFNLGALYQERGEWEKAAEWYSEAASYEPRDAEIRLRLADALRALGRHEESLPHYGRAIALEAGLEAAWVGEAETLVRLGRFEDAINRLETAHGLIPTSGRIAQGLARLLAACPDLDLRDGQRALDLALRVAKARPTLLHVQTVAMAYAELGRCDTAAEWQSRALEASREAGHETQAAVLELVLQSYQAGPPCRPPVAVEFSP